MIYNGKTMNRESLRPKCGVTCIIPGRPGIEYELINILNHRAKYDSYVLRNKMNGKIRHSKMIEVNRKEQDEHAQITCKTELEEA